MDELPGEFVVDVPRGVLTEAIEDSDLDVSPAENSDPHHHITIQIPPDIERAARKQYEKRTEANPAADGDPKEYAWNFITIDLEWSTETDSFPY
ncbi:hypothetical protein CV102_14055 [Natronococcus pandeyae]|uniref:Uncharacterized protein n=2 Tax=Natronococcus pandeyae TaxID=2055836 RepID=A0A8J8TPK5_9EURY|nr:hypothetical protein CV102_14055 [Natronococcus pandeyae]